MSVADAAVRAHALTKSYGRVVALDGVDLRVAPAGVHGLVGPNGAGKSTLLGVLLGLVQRQGGELEVLGHPVGPRPLRTPAGVGGCVETPRFYPRMTARGNLALLATLDGSSSRRATRTLVDERLDRVGLLAVGDSPAGELSLGMRQRLGIAAGLLRDVRLLVLDEPVNGLDPSGMRAMRVLLRQLADDGVAVLVSSHHIGELEAVCDHVTMLRASRVVFDGSMTSLRQRAPDQGYWLHTGDDPCARRLLSLVGGILVRGVPLGTPRGEPGFAVSAPQDLLDAGVLRLAEAGVPMRTLRPLASPLEALYGELVGPRTPTDDPDEQPPTDPVPAAAGVRR